jgi:hypothetical protein
VHQAGVGSARAVRLDRPRVGVQANDAHALVRLYAAEALKISKNASTREYVYLIRKFPRRPNGEQGFF